jgi:tRNA G18 (ribose-2'-O)-methylase SpoU
MENQLHVRSFDSSLTPEEFRRIERHPIHIVLDNLRSAFNVGSIFRTADAALVARLHLCGITAYPPHRKLDKTSMGTLDYVPWEHHEKTEQTVTELKEGGIPIVCLEPTDRSRRFWEIDYPRPVCLVLGNEALGISGEVLRLADHLVDIPMLGYKNSINVATAFGVVLFEVLRQYAVRDGPEQ